MSPSPPARAQAKGQRFDQTTPPQLNMHGGSWACGQLKNHPAGPLANPRKLTDITVRQRPWHVLEADVREHQLEFRRAQGLQIFRVVQHEGNARQMASDPPGLFQHGPGNIHTRHLRGVLRPQSSESTDPAAKVENVAKILRCVRPAAEDLTIPLQVCFPGGQKSIQIPPPSTPLRAAGDSPKRVFSTQCFPDGLLPGNFGLGMRSGLHMQINGLAVEYGDLPPAVFGLPHTRHR